jgi:hypothetical protein
VALPSRTDSWNYRGICRADPGRCVQLEVIVLFRFNPRGVDSPSL